MTALAPVALAASFINAVVDGRQVTSQRMVSRRSGGSDDDTDTHRGGDDECCSGDDAGSFQKNTRIRVANGDHGISRGQIQRFISINFLAQ